MIEQLFTISYIAGYLDGDGCFYLGKTIQKPKEITVYEYSIQVLSIKREVLDFFVSKFGGYVRIMKQRHLHKIPYQWTLKGKKAAKLAFLVFEHLIDKKYACELFIKYSDTIFQNNFRIIPIDIFMERNQIITKIREDRHMNNFVTKEAIEALKLRKKTIDPVPKDYAYLAGLIDSEGCFRIKHWKPKNRPNEVYNIHLEIGNTKFPIMPWLMERFGGSITYVPEKTRKRSSAIWSLSSKSLFEILPKIHPYLRNKKEVCEKLIEFQNTILPNGGDRHSELFHALFTKNRALRDKIISEVHQLNLKGSKL